MKLAEEGAQLLCRNPHAVWLEVTLSHAPG